MLSAQSKKDGQVPEVVRLAFDKKYPDTYVYDWDYKKKRGIYEAEFMSEGCKHKAVFTTTGTWVSTEKKIRLTDLPSAVRDTFDKSDYSQWKTDDIRQYFLAAPPNIFYSIEVEKGKYEEDLFFTVDGNRLEKATVVNWFK